MKRVLVIAGSDSSGGAGLEADQKVISAHGCYAMTATTALTVQNTLGVSGIHETPSEFVKQQIDACADDVGVDVVKTGMLASTNTVKVVAEALRAYKLPLSVIDPVMVATSGAQLLPENAVKTLCSEILPQAFILTPNIPEANLILREAGQLAVDINGIDDLKRLAAAIQKLGVRYVLLKGGHIPLTSDYKVAQSDGDKKIIVNVLTGNDVVNVFESGYQISKSTHGTGCSLASAIACNLANGLDVEKATRIACRYIDVAIKTSPGLGKGSGPLNHFHSLQRMPFSSGTFIDYLLEREDVKPAWHNFTHHEFVRKLGDGTLPYESFKHYMIQDYLYLKQFARANALAGYKSKSLDDIAGAAAIVTHIRHEINLHISECQEFGISQEEMERHEESQGMSSTAPTDGACTAYSRYVLDIGGSEDWFALQIALLPCLLGYGMIASRLHQLQQTDPPKAPNRYKKWIDNYVAEDYTAAVETGKELIEKHAAQQSPSRIEELVAIFVHATNMETGFWEMASSV